MDRYLAKLNARINYERQVRVAAQHFKLNNVRALLARTGRPDQQYPIIHVAGTKGKGSVATMIANILTAAGHTTGLFTSPHLTQINERIVVDGRPIATTDLDSVLEELDPQIAAMDQICQSIAQGKPADAAGLAGQQWDRTGHDPIAGITVIGKPLTFFEIITTAALSYFQRKKCDAVVLEVGLGGRLDSTNVCQPVASVITNISLDHTRQLGDTIDKIAFEKAGIIKPGAPVISGETKPLAANVIAAVAKQHQVDLIQLDRDFSFHDQPKPVDPSTDPATLGCPFSYSIDCELAKSSDQPDDAADRTPLRYDLENLHVPMLGNHQRSNAALAITTVLTLRNRGWAIDRAAIVDGLQNTRIAGRTQIVKDRSTVVLDVAHNVASMSVLLKTLASELPAWHNGRRVLLLSISKEKDARGMLEALLPEFQQVVITKYQNNPRGIDAGRLHDLAVQVATELGLADIELAIQADPPSAWKSIGRRLRPEDIVVATGSVFLVAELTSLLNPDGVFGDQ